MQPAILGSACLFIALAASVMVARANPLSYDASEPQVLDREFGALVVVGVVGFLVGVGAGRLLGRTVLGAGLAVSAWRRLRPPRRLEGPRRHR